MSKRVFFWGLVVWLAFFYVGIHWTTKPYLTPLPASPDPRAAVQKTFLIRLAKLDNSNLAGHAERIATETTTPPPPFDYGDWMWRESRNRACVFMLIYFGAGWVLHWLLSLIQRDKIWLG